MDSKLISTEMQTYLFTLHKGFKVANLLTLHHGLTLNWRL